MPRSCSTRMNGSHLAIASRGTGEWPFRKSACFTRLTSPIHANIPGYSASSSSMPGRTVSGRDRSGEGHGQRCVDAVQRAGHDASRVGEVVLERGRHERSGTVEVVGAWRVHGEHLPDPVDVHEPYAGVAQVSQELVEGDGTAAEGSEVEVAVHDRGLRLGGAVVASGLGGLGRLERLDAGAGWGGAGGGGAKESDGNRQRSWPVAAGQLDLHE